METATRGVEASVSHLLKGSGLLFWMYRIKLPILRSQVLGHIRRTNSSIAKQNLALIELGNALKLDGEGLVDPDLRIRDLLESIKVRALEFRQGVMTRKGSNLAKDKKSGHILSGMDRSIALTTETFELANSLQWQIAEHDADVAPRHEGFLASSADELANMLDRL
ncbi:hypothetical protein [Paraburkholderia bannensis]|uniref:hypothetical protein n=1 Tax=Paraburkholderia bannensis TaxID=765414 RepID=UPI002AB15A1C|nr:hypothetical protein [Paraburkholderia bannensis]